MQRAQHESGESRKLESGTTSRTGTAVERNRIVERAHRGIQRSYREPGATELSAGGTAEASEGRGHADRAGVFADLGRSAPLPQESRRGWVSGTATGTQEVRRERTAATHQQRGRSVSADAAGAGSAAYLGTVRDRL